MENASATSRRVLGLHIPGRRGGWIFLIPVAVVLLDQASKWLVQSRIDRGEEVPEGWPVQLVHVTNSGAAFGILQDAGPLLVIASLVGAAVLLVYLLNPGFAHPLMRVGLALMLGGAVGNLIDRLAAGEVVDFIKVPQWPAFNIADSAISVGVLCLLWVILFDPSPVENDENS